LTAARFGLRKTHRLLRPQDFAAVMKSRSQVRDEHFSVYGLPNRLERGRLGLTVSTKTAPQAVARNRIKRTVREAFRLNPAAMTGLDVVVIARPQARAADSAALRAALQQHWVKIAALCKNL